MLGILAGLACCAAPRWALAEKQDPRIAKVVSRGLDWLASTQSRLGHWTANDGRYPTAMTALAGMALLCEGSTTTQGKYAAQHPPGGRLSGQPQPAQRPDRRSDARRSLHLRPRLSPCSFSPRCWARRRTPSAASN